MDSLAATHNLNKFFVDLVPYSDWDDFSGMAWKWSRIAKEKFKSQDPKESSLQNLKASWKACKALFIQIELFYEGDVLACKNSEGAVLAIALHNKITNTLNYLVTHPHNITTRGAEGSISRVSGAASEIIYYLGRKTLESDYPLSLTVISSAIPFYLKLKFKFVGMKKEDVDAAIESDRTIMMELTTFRIMKYKALYRIAASK